MKLACWDLGFESHRGHGYLSVVSVVCVSGRGLCDELITRPEESYRLCCVVVCDLETSRMVAPYIYDISSLKVNSLTLILLTWRKWWALIMPANSRWDLIQAFKGWSCSGDKGIKVSKRSSCRQNCGNHGPSSNKLLICIISNFFVIIIELNSATVTITGNKQSKYTISTYYWILLYKKTNIFSFQSNTKIYVCIFIFILTTYFG